MPTRQRGIEVRTTLQRYEASRWEVRWVRHRASVSEERQRVGRQAGQGSRGGGREAWRVKSTTNGQRGRQRWQDSRVSRVRRHWAYMQ